MACKLTMSVISESQVGVIGDDWKYDLEAKVYSPALTGTGTISVAEHILGSGTTQEPPGPPDAVTMDAGDCETELRVKLNLKATEVDFFRSDSGAHEITVTLQCPGPGSAPISNDQEISVGVRESPGLTEKSAILNLVVRLVASCD